MSLIKWNRNRLFPTFPSFFDVAGWDEDFMSTFMEGKNMPAVNISETDKFYLMEFAVPGMAKSDFHVKVEEGMLCISAEKEEKKEVEEKDYKRREYNFETFERRFSLPENVDDKNIKAKYEDGVLKITLTKTAVKVSKTKEVKVV